MKYKIGIYVCLLGLLLQNNSEAQQNTNKMLSAGLLTSHHTLKDDGMSALVYHGYYPGIRLQFLNESPHLDQKIGIRASTGKLNNEINSNTVNLQTFELSYTPLFKLLKLNEAQLALGGISANSLELRGNTGFLNNKNYYEFSSSAEAAVKLSYRLGTSEKGNKYLITTFFSVPFVTAITRSNSIHNRWNDFPSSSFKNYVRNIQLVSFNKYINLNWETELRYTINKNSSLSVGYQWNYRYVKEAAQLQSIVHTAMINYFFL